MLVMTEVTFAVHCVTVPLDTDAVLQRNLASAGTSCDSCANITLVLERFRFVLSLLLLLYGIVINVNTWDSRDFV